MNMENSKLFADRLRGHRARRGDLLESIGVAKWNADIVQFVGQLHGSKPIIPTESRSKFVEQLTSGH